MKKVTVFFLVIALCLMMSVGCKKKDDTSSGATNTPIDITHWYWADNPDYSAKMQQIVKDFNENNDQNIKVTAQEYPWDGGGYSETLFTAAMGGGGPDTAAWKLTSTPLFKANNLLANLDGYINDWTDKEDIEENLYNVMRNASGTDNIYVMPWNTQVLYVYYRPSMFKAVNIAVPTTYDEFLEACRKLTRDTDKNGKTDVYGFGMRGAKGGQEPWGSFIYGRGGDFTNFSTPQAIAGMQDFINLYKNGYVPPTAPTDGFNEIIANFKSGKTAMTIHHIGSSSGMVEALGEDVDAFPFPKGTSQWTSMGDTENVIFEACDNKDAAFEWVAYLATGKGQEEWCKTTGNVPVSKRVQAMPEFQNNKFMKVSIQGAPSAGIFPILDTTTEWINTIWPNTTAAALAGQKTAEQAMADLQKGLYGS
ncbi:MAG: sugar ABC transporter substrate-binding protein [Oscillospiraceae bacterium]|nr:sugar ABC transporter substrate-binding protein [Oscillospiraceae bacterium]MDD4414034.1 sugar ABC transporter substrate-binding protein [Oscillospiraceae bacterium]